MSIVSSDATSQGTAPEAEALEPGSVLRRLPSPHVEWVDVEGEIVAWNADTESLHLLDPIAAIVFQLLDGVTSLEQTSRELAEAFGRHLDLVRADVLSFATSLRQIGIVEEAR